MVVPRTQILCGNDDIKFGLIRVFLGTEDEYKYGRDGRGDIIQSFGLALVQKNGQVFGFFGDFGGLCSRS